MTDQQLQHRFNTAIIQISVWTSTVPAANPAPSRPQPASTLLAGRWKGDAHTYQHRWNTEPARRHELVDEMEAHLQAVRQPEPLKVTVREETPVERDLRAIQETQDLKPEEVHLFYGYAGWSPAKVKRLRRNYGRDPLTGRLSEVELSKEERKIKAVEMHRDPNLKMTRNAIADTLGLHHEDVKRAIAKAASQSEHDRAA